MIRAPKKHEATEQQKLLGWLNANDEVAVWENIPGSPYKAGVHDLLRVIGSIEVKREFQPLTRRQRLKAKQYAEKGVTTLVFRGEWNEHKAPRFRTLAADDEWLRMNGWDPETGRATEKR